MDKNYLPQPLDENMRLEASAQKTANFAGTTKDLGVNFAPGGVGRAMAAVINATAVDRTTGDETYSFTLMESSDNSTFTACGPAVTIDVSGNSATLGTYCVPGFVSKRYVAVALTVAGTTPIITYESWLAPEPCVH